MIEIIAISISVISVLILTGIPLTLVLFFKKNTSNNLDFSFFIASSLIIGFGTSALSASIAYSFFDINKYFSIYSLIAIIYWVVLIRERRNLFAHIQKISAVGGLILPFTFSIYFCSSQWDDKLRPILTSAPGPDVSQNLMAAQVAEKIGKNWSQTSANLLEKLDVANLNNAYAKLFELPSFKEFAGFEYMIFGLRWGLTVPMNQLIKIFGPQVTMLEIGSVLMITLFALSIIFYACCNLFIKNKLLALVFTIILISNGAFLFQYFYGGISQAFGAISTGGVLLSLLLIVINHEKNKEMIDNKGIFVLFTFSWTGLLVCYSSAALILMPTLILFGVIVMIITRKVFNLFFVQIASSILATLFINPILTYSLLSTFANQRANLQTGYNTGIWQSPIQLLGLLSVYPKNGVLPSYTAVIVYFTFFLTIILAASLITILIKSGKKPDLFACLSLLLLFINFIALVVSYNGPSGSDYIYNKINVYLHPLSMFAILLVLSRSTLVKRFNFIVFSGILILVVTPSISYTEIFSKSNETIRFPYEYRQVLMDKAIQEYLNSKNFIQPYKIVYNFSGVFGAEYSIGRAPNTSNLESRMNNELIIFCFTGDPECKPQSVKISNPKLEVFGISEYQSNLSTLEFSELPIRQKFNYVFDSVNSDIRNIDERFVGGNPYLK
jgi:hypothetical protein